VRKENEKPHRGGIIGKAIHMGFCVELNLPVDPWKAVGLSTVKIRCGLCTERPVEPLLQRWRNIQVSQLRSHSDSTISSLRQFEVLAPSRYNCSRSTTLTGCPKPSRVISKNISTNHTQTNLEPTRRQYTGGFYCNQFIDNIRHDIPFTSTTLHIAIRVTRRTIPPRAFPH